MNMKKYVYSVLIGTSLVSYPLGWYLPQSWLITAISWIIASTILFVYGKRLIKILKEFWGCDEKDKPLSVCLLILLFFTGLALSAWWLGDFTAGYLGLGIIIWVILGWIITATIAIISYILIGAFMIVCDIIDTLKKKH